MKANLAKTWVHHNCSCWNLCFMSTHSIYQSVRIGLCHNSWFTMDIDSSVGGAM